MLAQYLCILVTNYYLEMLLSCHVYKILFAVIYCVALYKIYLKKLVDKISINKYRVTLYTLY